MDTLNLPDTERPELSNAPLQRRLELTEQALAATQLLINTSLGAVLTPLHGIIGYAQLGENEQQADKLRGHCVQILALARQLEGVLGDIDDYVRSDRHAQRLPLQVYDLSDLIGQVSSQMQANASRRGVVFTLKLDPALPPSQVGNSAHLRKLLDRLLTHVLHVSAPASTIVLHAGRETATLIFSIQYVAAADIAVAGQTLPTPTANATEGLGLLFCQRLAKHLEGTLHSEEQPGAQSRITVRVPLLEPVMDIGRASANAHQSATTVATSVATTTHEDTQEETPISAASGKRLQGVRVLAADDVDFNRFVLEDMLSSEGASVVMVENGQEAVERVRSDGTPSFDVVLMDVQMPVMDGLEATRHIVQLAPALPVLAVTAHALPEEYHRCLDAGMREHLTKPLSVDALVSAILRHTQHYQIDRATLAQRYAGRPALLKRLLLTISERHNPTAAALESAIAAKDYAAITTLAHELKSAGDNLAADALRHLAEATESLAYLRDAKSLRMAAQLAHVMRDVSDELQGALQEMATLPA